jgi:aminocarboxymuconate-semialdehyde decarboxylase
MSRVIDIQTHYVPPRALEWLLAEDAKGAAWPAGLQRSSATGVIAGLDERLRAMDGHGVDISVLSFSPLALPHLGPAEIELCRIANDGLLAACEAHPDRFVMLAGLPLCDMAAAGAECDRLAGEGAMRGIALVAQVRLYRPEETGIEMVLEQAATRGLAVVLHPSAGLGDMGSAFTGFGLESALQSMTSHAAVAARMILSGMLDRLPGLDLILTHLGGVLPFLAERFDSRAKGVLKHDFRQYLRERLHYDICGYADAPALRCAIETLGIGRMMIGSDWPSRRLDDVLAVARSLAIDDDARAALIGGTAGRWFGPRV